jgi:hypothetical protein
MMRGRCGGIDGHLRTAPRRWISCTAGATFRFTWPLTHPEAGRSAVDQQIIDATEEIAYHLLMAAALSRRL